MAGPDDSDGPAPGTSAARPSYWTDDRRSGRHRDQPHWRRLLVALLLTPLVVAWWLAYQLRRGWYGPVD
jgi:hypothetical protein